MNRRQFSRRVGLGAIGAAALAPAAKAADVSGPARSEKKEWAHEHLKGLGSLILPSFTPDFKSLDEEAIRHDIRHRSRASPPARFRPTVLMRSNPSACGNWFAKRRRKKSEWGRWEAISPTSKRW